jgi:hypothetical protein
MSGIDVPSSLSVIYDLLICSHMKDTGNTIEIGDLQRSLLLLER